MDDQLIENFRWWRFYKIFENSVKVKYIADLSRLSDSETIMKSCPSVKRDCLRSTQSKTAIKHKTADCCSSSALSSIAMYHNYILLILWGIKQVFYILEKCTYRSKVETSCEAEGSDDPPKRSLFLPKMKGAYSIIEFCFIVGLLAEIVDHVFIIMLFVQKSGHLR